MIPYGRQHITAEDIAAVREVLESDFLTQGPALPAFERNIAKRCQAQYVVAVSNATAALHLACLALDLQPGDRLWTSPNSFVASANCGLYCDAEVDFVDIDPNTWNISTTALAQKLQQAERDGVLPKVMVVVHFAGLPCDMASIHELCQRYRIKLIEDASHAVGARYRDEPVGNCRYSDITVFSFHPVKIVTTGEGGALTTQDPHLAQRLRLLRSHGITREPSLLTQTDIGGWYYEQQLLGYNYRMTDIAAALGSSQLQRLDQYLARRAELVANYQQRLAHLSDKLLMQHAAPDSGSSWHLFVIALRHGENVAGSRKNLYQHMRQAGIGVNVHYRPIYLQPYYQQLGFGKHYCVNAEHYYEGALTLPLHPQLTEAEQDFVITTLESQL